VQSMLTMLCAKGAAELNRKHAEDAVRESEEAASGLHLAQRRCHLAHGV